MYIYICYPICEHTHTRFSTVSPSLYASRCIKIRLVCSCVTAHNTSDCEVFNAIWFNHYRNLDLGSSRHPVGTQLSQLEHTVRLFGRDFTYTWVIGDQLPHRETVFNRV